LNIQKKLEQICIGFDDYKQEIFNLVHRLKKQLVNNFLLGKDQYPNTLDLVLKGAEDKEQECTAHQLLHLSTMQADELLELLAHMVNPTPSPT
jgi:hypothetical protein